MSDFVFVIMGSEDNEGSYIQCICKTKQLALKELKKIAKQYNTKISKEQVRVGITTFDIEEYKVLKELEEGKEK